MSSNGEPIDAAQSRVSQSIDHRRKDCDQDAARLVLAVVLFIGIAQKSGRPWRKDEGIVRGAVFVARERAMNCTPLGGSK